MVRQTAPARGRTHGIRGAELAGFRGARRVRKVAYFDSVDITFLNDRLYKRRAD